MLINDDKRHKTIKMINKMDELNGNNKNMINVQKNETFKKENINEISKEIQEKKKENKINKNINKKNK
jgi:hypothetical protein